jgi:starvation-inducible DNA-binding protein
MAENVNIGLDRKARDEVATGLSKLLADTFAIYLKTHGYHWNVVGPNFAGLHALLEEQYTETWNAIDLIAERVRGLGGLAPMSYRTFSNLSGVQDGDPEKPWDGMLKELVADHERFVADARAVRAKVDKATDDATTSLIDDRVLAHEKHAWMLRASLGDR